MTGGARVGVVTAVVVVALTACGGSAPGGVAAGGVGSPGVASRSASSSIATGSSVAPGPTSSSASDPSRPVTATAAPMRSGTAAPDPAATPPAATPPAGTPVTGLREATTFTTARGTTVVGPVSPDGVVLHPRTSVAVFTAPGGRVVAALPATQLGSPTWVPVLREVGGWSEVLLPSRPNGSTGWVASGDHGGYDLARSDAVVRVRLREARMSIERDGRQVGSWPVVIGAPATPTPAGTTFVMASVEDPGNAYSRYLLPLGWHSNTLDSFGGGPGTVAVHGWRDPSIFTRRDRELSHGCIRVPKAALSVARSLPLGTLIVIS